MSRTRSFKTLVLGGWFVRFLQIANNLLLIPLILAKIGSEQYGYWLATGGVLAWASACDFGVVGIIKQRCAYHLGQKNGGKAIQYFQTGALVYIPLLCLMLAVVFGLSFLLKPLLGIPEEYALLYQLTFLLAGLAIAFSILKGIFAAYLQAIQKTRGDIVSRIVGQLLNLIIVIYLLVWTPLGLWAIPIGLFANHFVSVLVVMGYTQAEGKVLTSRVVFDKGVLRDYLHTSPVLLFARLGSQLTMKIEPTLIVIFLTPELATMFTVAKRLIEVMMGFANAVRGAMLAGFSHYFGEKGGLATVDLLDRILQMTLGLSFGIAMVYLGSNRHFVGIWVGPDLYIGTLICAFIGLEALTKSVADSMIHLVGALGEMRRSSLALLAESIAKVGLMFVFLPLLGIVGLPLAAILGGIGKAVYSFHRLKSNLDEVCLDVTRPFVSSVLGLGSLAGAALLGSYGVGQSPWLWLPVTLLISGVCATSYVLWALPFVRREFLSAFEHFRSRLPVLG